MTENKNGPKGAYANIFVPSDLRDRIDAVRDILGLKSRTEVVRISIFLIERATDQFVERIENNAYEPALIEALGVIRKERKKG